MLDEFLTAAFDYCENNDLPIAVSRDDFGHWYVHLTLRDDRGYFRTAVAIVSRRETAVVYNLVTDEHGKKTKDTLTTACGNKKARMLTQEEFRVWVFKRLSRHLREAREARSSVYTKRPLAAAHA